MHTARPVAVAGLSGPTLRYAEVLPGPTLRRLGAADFAFDAERVAFAGDAPNAPSDALGVIADALRDGLGGTDAPALVVAAHPTATTAFFTPLPVGIDPEARDAQVRQETALLADLPSDRPVRARARAVRTEATIAGARDWYHVVHADDGALGRLGALAGALGLPAVDIADSTRAASAAAGDGARDGGPVLLVGAYGRHTEVAVAVGGEFRFGTHGPSTEATDTAYFALAALQQAGVAAPDVAALRVYGDAATAERLGLVVDFVGRAAVALDPFGPFRRRPSGDAADLAAFAPVLGAALVP